MLHTLTTKQGAALLRAAKQGTDLTQALCELYGAKSPDELSRGEMHALTDTVKAFTEVVTQPRDLKDIRISLVMRDRAVELGRFGELDVTLRALEMLEAFNPEECDRVAVMLACIYAPTVRRALFPNERDERIAAELADAWAEQVPFADSFVMYDFFANWKADLQTTSALSLRAYMRLYRRRTKWRRGWRHCALLSWIHIRMWCARLSAVIRGWICTAATFPTRTRRCSSTITKLLRGRLLKRPTRPRSGSSESSKTKSAGRSARFCRKNNRV